MHSKKDKKKRDLESLRGGTSIHIWIKDHSACQCGIQSRQNRAINFAAMLTSAVKSFISTSPKISGLTVLDFSTLPTIFMCTYEEGQKLKKYLFMILDFFYIETMSTT